jgi:HK97 gp10 family phage protein
MANRVRIDSGKVKGLAKRLRDTKDQLQAGWFEAAKYDDNTPVAQVAAWQEYGTRTAPPRPFMRPAADGNRAKWVESYYKVAKNWIGGNGDYNTVLTTLGLVVQADIKNEISGNHLPLSPVTLALRRLKNDGVPIGKRTVGMVASAIARGETGPGQLGQPFANQDPLRDTGYMLATLTYEIVQ